MKKLLIASAVTAGFLGSAVAHADVSTVLDGWQDRAYGQAKIGTTDM